MFQMIHKMKNNLSFLTKGKESSLYYSDENNRGKRNTKILKNLLQKNFKKIQNIKSLSIHNKIKNKEKLKSNKDIIMSYNLINKSNNLSKNNSLLFDLTQISPIKKLKYELALYAQKEKLGNTSKTKKKYKTNQLSFIKKSFLGDNNLCPKPNFKKSNYNYANKSCIFSPKIKIFTPYRPKSAQSASARSRPPFSSRTNKKNFSYRLKKETKKIEKQINTTIKEINNASMDLQKDIILTNKYDNLNNINNLYNYKKNFKKNKSCINIKEINKELKLDEDEKTYSKKIMERRFKYLDKNSKKYLKECIIKLKNEDRLLGKNFRGKFYDLEKRKEFRNLKNKIKESEKDIICFKKEYKGIQAIIPHSESNYIHKLIKENMYDNKKIELIYFDELISRSNNINRCFNSREIREKRIALLHKKSKSKHKNYQYMNK